MSTKRRFRKFLSDVLRDWDTGEHNFALGGDYSLEPAYYEWVAPVRIGLRKLVAVIVADEVDDPRLFGHGPALLVGLHFTIADENGDDVYELTVRELDGINDNGDMLHFFHSSQTLGGGFSGVPPVAVPVERIYVWELADGDRGIEILDGWRIRVLAHDDFSTRCSNFHVHFQGMELYEEQR